ncbi:hypothetical protein AX766_01740 [Flavobacterium covae]|uniref:DUF5777 family beta-barrel protein n=1 Tax=Flavobacterium covae TaxID=2906076 RepID=A0ABW8PFL2_9FLAO|nr:MULTISPECIES: DUF5777 family beta-barrel protein [Flavobacterium]AND63237.1 hypothetical protein AX766_01740 [Flavobacterium covae]OWP82482.1 hypothetical protein BWK63_00230 [Flavobacterium covae]OXA80517.1 hypothetical protein B0A56_06990 [Flavobacterium columnare NBRC 100251 = ATCC 23463]POR22493.1 hypothetical protein BWK57_05820 [Flavobacterium columnare]
MLKKILLGFSIVLSNNLQAQDDLLKGVENNDSEVVESAFKSLKIVNLESTKLASKGDLYFIVSHRFGFLNSGFENFFGLDGATTQLKMVYGLTDDVTLHFSRSTFAKTYDAGIKYKIISQKKEGFPFTIVGYNALAINSAMKKEAYPLLEFKHRLSYNSQVLVSRKFNDQLTLQLAPTFFYENVVLNPEQKNAQFAVGMGGRYKLSKRFSLNVDYAAHLNRIKNSNFRDPLSVGVDLETGGHIFQMFFTNANAMHDTGYLGRTAGNWAKGEISFGFNLVRVF